MTERLGPDPLDPHGDGTIRPGDPMWEVFMSGEVVHAVRSPDDDAEWEVTHSLPADGGGERDAGRGEANPPGRDLGRRRDSERLAARGWMFLIVLGSITVVAVCVLLVLAGVIP